MPPIKSASVLLASSPSLAAWGLSCPTATVVVRPVSSRTLPRSNRVHPPRLLSYVYTNLLATRHRCLPAYISRPALRCFGSSSCPHEVIDPSDVDLLSNVSPWNDERAPTPHSGEVYTASEEASAASSVAWQTTLSPAVPSTFTDVTELDPFARARMLGFVRRHRVAVSSSSSRSGDEDHPPANGFETEAVGSDDLFHARLLVPLTASAKACIGGVDVDSVPSALVGLWAHGVSNTAKDAELLAAMHAEQIADLLGYHLYALPSKQRKHAEAARATGRYASSPDDTEAGPSAEWRRIRWPLPLRRVLTDEETEGGEWQLVDTASSSRDYLCPPHTLLSPCVFDPLSRGRIESFFAQAQQGSPSFGQQLTTENVRTLTASSATTGGKEAVVAQLELPPEVIGIQDSSVKLVARGKAMKRNTAIQLACMHAELLLDTVHVPIFDDPNAQTMHAMAAWSYGRPAPLPGTPPKMPSHVHLPPPLKELTAGDVFGRQRTSIRSAEEEWFHRHALVTEQSGSFVETQHREDTAVDDVKEFLTSHGAPRASAPFLQVRIGSRVKSTVLLQLPDSYGIRGGVGIASTPEDADVLAAMHALDILCMLGVPVKVSSEDAAWKASRRERVAGVPEEVTDISAASPPARRCSVKKMSASPPSTATEPVAPSPLPRTRRSTKRAVLASEAAAPPDVSPNASSAGADTPPLASSPSSVVSYGNVDDERVQQLTAARAEVAKEHWDLSPDSPDGYIMISPYTPDLSGTPTYAIASPRKMDKHSKQRVMEYLASVGRRFDDVVVRQVVGENELEDCKRHRCALKLPLPVACGEPRLALGEAESAADAESVACMHAELLLDSLGVCLYTDPKRQKLHAKECGLWGRWAPYLPGEEKPSSTVAPPPLRQESVGSLHWERKKKGKAKKAVSGFNIGAARAKSETPSLGTHQPDQSTSALQRAADNAPQAEEVTMTGEDDTLYEYLSDSAIDTLSKYRVQYYLRYEKLQASKVSFSATLGRGVVFHVASWTLPVASRYLDCNGSPKNLVYTVKGAAPTRRDAEHLSWMHAERILDGIGIPIFPNLPQLQAYHAQRAEAAGRRAPAMIAPPPVPLPPPEQMSILPLRLRLGLGKLELTIPTPPPEYGETEADGASRVSLDGWNAYIEACTSYVDMKRLIVNNTAFDEERVPRSGDTVLDAALSEAEATPLDHFARLHLSCYASARLLVHHRRVENSTVGPLHHRVAYATVQVPGFEYLYGCGVGSNKANAERRAAMHALAILRRVDESYEDTYALCERYLLKMKEGLRKGGEACEGDSDTFDLETFSTLPLIFAEAQTAQAYQEKRHRHRFSALFVQELAWYSQSRVFTTDGQRRAVRLYTLCCGLDAPKERTFVRLLPREEEPTSLKECRNRDATLDLGNATSSNIMASRVMVGATFSARVSVMDEDGQVWEAQCGGGGATENIMGAYERLFVKMEKGIPMMKNIVQLMKEAPYLRPESIPSLEIPAKTRKRMQACLTNQQDLIATNAEFDADSWAKQSKWRNAPHPVEQKFVASGELLTPAQRDAYETQESAHLVEKLQKRLTDPLYVESFAPRRSQLSIAEHKQEILATIRANPVTIICGTTGCGKTTQVPQYILDAETEDGRGGRCSIVVTQPRRLSAVSIARRIAAERMEEVGESTGYMIRFQPRAGRHITLVTNGILLRQLQKLPSLDMYNYIIIDEIHERDMDSDFILLLLRDLPLKRPDVRIILMSATLQATQFQKYFGGAPLIEVEGRMFPVKDVYLEDLVPYAQVHHCFTPLIKEAAAAVAAARESQRGNLHGDESSLPVSSPTGRDAAGISHYGVLAATTPIDYPAIQLAIEYALHAMDLADSAILVFLPGWEEIRLAMEILERNTAYHILPLHSAVSPEAQLKCFLPPPLGKTKIILSTNIAESGVTIDNIGVVIDTGRVKEQTYATRSRTFVPKIDSHGYDSTLVEDHAHVTAAEGLPEDRQGKYSQLVEVYASRASCMQRRGRAGRTRPGLCIRLYSREHFRKLHEYQTPQLLRMPLDSICLRILYMSIGEPTEVLERAIEPPLPSEVIAAVRRLHDIGAVTAEGKLTPLGWRMAELPVSPHIAKAILFGVAFRCLDTALTTAATSHEDVFESSILGRTASRLYREDISRGTLSDTIAKVNGFNYWVSLLRHETAARARQLAKERYLSPPALARAAKIKLQLYKLLLDSGLIEAADQSNGVNAAVKGFSDAMDVFVDRTENSRHALDVGITKCIISVSAFPNVGMLAGPEVLRTAFENYIQVGGNSVIRTSAVTPTTCPFLIFQSLRRIRSKHALMAEHVDSISVWTLILMSSRSMKLDYLQELNLGSLNGWIFIRASFGTLEMVRRFKALLDRRLNRKFSNPDDAKNNARLDELCEVVMELTNAPFCPNKLVPESSTWGDGGSLIDPFAEISEEGKEEEVCSERIPALASSDRTVEATRATTNG